jgi:hypothetical protein
MKKWFLGLILAIGIIVLGSAGSAFAAGNTTAVSPRPFTGTFEGVVYGDYGSSAPLTLELTQRGTVVTGTAVIGQGLRLNAGGFCGAADVPAVSATADGNTNRRQPRQLSTTIPFEFSGMTITALAAGQLSADSEELDVSVKIDTPFPCGRDPIISGTLLRAVNS